MSGSAGKGRPAVLLFCNFLHIEYDDGDIYIFAPLSNNRGDDRWQEIDTTHMQEEAVRKSTRKTKTSSKWPRSSLT